MVEDDGSALAAEGTAGLAERLAALEARVAELERRGGMSGGAGYGAAPVQDAVDPWSLPPWPEVVALLHQRKKIQAIKVHREHTGAGLQESKDVVEEVERRLGLA